jgi:hypothetical protein
VNEEFVVGSVSTGVARTTFLGLKDMVFVFTKFVQPIISYARKQGHEASAYLDDLHALARSEKKCLESIIFIRNVKLKASKSISLRPRGVGFWD